VSKIYSFPGNQSADSGDSPNVLVFPRPAHAQARARWPAPSSEVPQRESRHGHPSRFVATASASALQATLDQGVSIVQTDQRGQISQANPCYCALLGYSETELLGMHMQDLLHDNGSFRQHKSFERLLGRGKRFILESRYRRKNGAVVWLRNSVLPICDTTGHARQAIVVAIDMTACKRTEAKQKALWSKEKRARQVAEAAMQATNEFLMTVSHELRAPLNSISGWAHVLALAASDSETVAKAITIIKRNVESQRRLVEDLLDVTRLVRGHFPLAIKPVNLAAIVREVTEDARITAETQGISLTLAIDSGTPPIAGDPTRLQQIMWNLLSNAIKFTPARGAIEVRLKRQNAHLHLMVSDTGEGISPDLLPHVFDRFRQADNAPSDRYGGLGLGLSIVRAITELHGGQVSVVSGGLGKGTTFTVRLPIRPVATAMPEPSVTGSDLTLIAKQHCAGANGLRGHNDPIQN
jgi:PAS domain S-box-containing protein